MIKQKKFLVNPKGQTISQSLGIKEDRVETLIDVVRKAYLNNDNFDDAMTSVYKEAKNQEEFLFVVHCLGIQKGITLGKKKAEVSLSVGIGNSNGSFWAALDALVVFTILFGLVGTIISFPHNWWLIPLDLLVLVLIFLRRK